MKILIRIAAVAAVGFTLSIPSSASAQSGRPAVGAERRAILDALRGPVQRRLGPNVEFVVHETRVVGGWAYVLATPQRRGGRPIDPRILPGYDRDSGFDVTAILRSNGRRWRVVRHEIGAGDVWYCGMGPRGLTPRCDGSW
jgi:hypothetical protein